jgi:chitin elicitor receptor kinase 1
MLDEIIMSTFQVADFGLTKLTEVGNTSLPTRGIVGTFGYMPPEYVS